MQNLQLIAICFCIAIIAYFYGRSRIIRQANIAQSRPNSLTVFYGLFPALLGLIVSLIVMAIWLVSESIIMDMMLLNALPDALTLSADFSASVALAQIYNLADGISVGKVEGWVKEGAAQFIAWKSSSNMMMSMGAIASSLLCSLYGIRLVDLKFRARNAVERIIYLGLVACSIVAILTTIGIVFSVIFESIRFFRLISPLEFLTGLTWNPEFEGAARAGSGQAGMSAYGSIPLFAGTFLISIIALTVVIKLLFFHLSAASYRSMARMRKLQPKLVQLCERYGDDRQKMNQAMMELYRKEKINPLGGCLPILIQIPVFISLYWVLLESVELRQAPFMLWLNDLSTHDPYFVLPVIMGASMFIQHKLNPTPPDPVQAKVMMALPFIFTFFFLWFPSGLVLYWVVNNILSITQQYIITRRIEAEK